MISFFATLTSCDQKFDKAKWLEQGDLRMYTYRKTMINDLMSNHKIKGLTYKQLIDLLGDSDKYVDSDANVLYYDVITNYGSDIDPIYSKTLKIKLDKDSTVQSFKVEEWKK